MLLILFATLILTVTTVNGCGSGYKSISWEAGTGNGIGNACIGMFSRGHTFNQCEDLCRLKGGSLARFDSAEKLEAVDSAGIVDLEEGWPNG